MTFPEGAGDFFGVEAERHGRYSTQVSRAGAGLKQNSGEGGIRIHDAFRYTRSPMGILLLTISSIFPMCSICLRSILYET